MDEIFLTIWYTLSHPRNLFNKKYFKYFIYLFKYRMKQKLLTKESQSSNHQKLPFSQNILVFSNLGFTIK